MGRVALSVSHAITLGTPSPTSEVFSNSLILIMVTVTLEELIAQTNALESDSALLQLYADTAEEQIEVDINRPLSELATTTQGESGSVTSYPNKIKLAVLLLVGHWYRNREAFDRSMFMYRELPKGYGSLIYSFRDFAKPYRK